jgi:peptidoglycan/LPS O-acetylase OafA/YrhL
MSGAHSLRARPGRGTSAEVIESAPQATGHRVRGLDGIRAVAVAGVLLFHGGVSGVGGGMLGVDVFFALSGFLITSLLVTEHERTSTIAFGRFYLRRARRLLPALFITLIGVAFYARYIADPATLSSLRGDALSTLAYVANWRFIFSDQSYFVVNGAPSPLLHTWSLAIEEQFYLLWPLICLLVLRRGSRRTLALVAALGALASFGTSLGLSLAGAGSARLYYGTDTRAQAILAGAVLGALGPLTEWSGRPGRFGRSATGRRALVAASLLGAAAVLFSFHAVAGNNAFLYRGGFLLVAVGTTAVIALAVNQPDAVLSRALSWRPLCYVGLISYGLYLYHYPLFLTLDHQRTGLSGASLLAVRLAATFAVAVASFHLVEGPVRTGRFFRRRWSGAAIPLGASVAVVALAFGTVAQVSPAAGTAPRAALAIPSPATAAQLRAQSGLAPGQSVSALLVGDSMTLTLGSGLEQDAGRWGVQVLNRSAIGCDLDPAATVNIEAGPTPTGQGCADWPARWAAQIRALKPDVVVIGVGRWETSDRLIDGHWTTIGHRDWDRQLAGLLNRAVVVMHGGGAKVVLLTLPYVQQTTEQPNGQPWDINLPSRTDAFNALVRRVAAQHPGVASVIDLNHLLDPDGHYTDVVDGVVVRNADKEHPSMAGGELLRPVILPQLLALGLPLARHQTTLSANGHPAATG